MVRGSDRIRKLEGDGTAIQCLCSVLKWYSFSHFSHL